MRARKVTVFLLVTTFAAACAAPGRTIPGGETVVAEAPALQVGDEWRFVGTGYRSRIHVVEVNADGPVTGRETRLARCVGCRFYRDTHLTILKVLDAQGQPWPEAEVGIKDLDFPLRVGKVWTQTVNLRSIGGRTFPYLSRYRVEAYERITVHAGTFKAFRISHYQENLSAPWKAVAQSWWSPEVRWFVRLDAPREQGVGQAGPGGIDIELESYSLK